MFSRNTCKEEGSDNTDCPQPAGTLSPSPAPRCRMGTGAGGRYLEEFLPKPKRLWIPLRDQGGETAQGGCPAGGLRVVGRYQELLQPPQGRAVGARGWSRTRGTGFTVHALLFAPLLGSCGAAAAVP